MRMYCLERQYKKRGASYRNHWIWIFFESSPFRYYHNDKSRISGMRAISGSQKGANALTTHRGTAPTLHSTFPPPFLVDGLHEFQPSSAPSGTGSHHDKPRIWVLFGLCESHNGKSRISGMRAIPGLLRERPHRRL